MRVMNRLGDLFGGDQGIGGIVTDHPLQPDAGFVTGDSRVLHQVDQHALFSQVSNRQSGNGRAAQLDRDDGAGLAQHLQAFEREVMSGQGHGLHEFVAAGLAFIRLHQGQATANGGDLQG